MYPYAVPEHVRELLSCVGDSYEKLHTLLALFRCLPAAATAEGLAAELGLAESTVVNALVELQALGVIVRGRSLEFTYVRDSGARDECLEWLAGNSETASVAIAKLLNFRAFSRVREALHDRLSFVIAMHPERSVVERPNTDAPTRVSSGEPADADDERE